MSSLIKNAFFLVTFIALIWFAWKLFFSGEDVGLVTQQNSEALVAQQKFLNQLAELRDLHLNSDIFVDPEFISLTDPRVEIVDEEAGRENPFAPVPGLKVSQ